MHNTEDIQKLRDYIHAQNRTIESGRWNYYFNTTLNRFSKLLIDASVYNYVPLDDIIDIVDESIHIFSAEIQEETSKIESLNNSFFKFGKYQEMENRREQRDLLIDLLHIFSFSFVVLKQSEE